MIIFLLYFLFNKILFPVNHLFIFYMKDILERFLKLNIIN